jgi:Domain of unknown function (DUF4234)
VKGNYMKKRSVAGVIIFGFITFGIYSIWWYASTKGELNNNGAKIPTTWLIIIPFVSIYWLWQYSVGAEQVSGQKIHSSVAFILLWLLGAIGQGILQSDYNNLSVSPVVAPAAPSVPQATAVPVQDAQPVEPVAQAPAAPVDAPSNDDGPTTPPPVQG